MIENNLISHKSINNKVKTKVHWKSYILSIIYWPIIATQIVLVFFYYNFYQFDIFHWLGWGSLGLFLVIGGLPKKAFKKYGDTEEGKSYLHTTKLVDKGIFGIIRHPYWLCWIILSISVTLISQHIIMIILTIIVLPIIYFETFSLDKGLIAKFGEDYKKYKKRVPRMNLILGLMKYTLLLKNNSKDNPGDLLIHGNEK
ncbi:MAG: hypothetical protein R3255_03740 [Candidatus Lokiarchaeia archaeon]|nr:hypothetical protein [Candidatus Lokiarchaeia archaeon]